MIKKMCIGLYVSNRYSPILMKFEFSRQIFEKYLISNIMEIRPLGAELSMWTDGRTGMTKLIVAFRNLASEPKNGIIVRIILHVKHFIIQLMHNIQSVSRLYGITAGGDFLGLCDQKSSYKHVSDFGRLRSYDRL